MPLARPPRVDSARRIPSASSPSEPDKSRSITNMRRVTSAAVGTGHDEARSAPVAANVIATSSMFSASSRKSSSSTIVSAKSSISAGGLARAATGIAPRGAGRAEAHHGEVRAPGGHPGRCTLTTTGLPRAAVPGCTWAMEAAAGIGARTRRTRLTSGPPELGLEEPAQRARRFGRHRSRTTELGHELGGEDPFARGDDLAELDVGGTEPPTPRGAGARPRAGTGYWRLRRSTKYQAAIAQERVPRPARSRGHGGNRAVAGRAGGPRTGWPRPHEVDANPARAGRPGSTSQGGWSLEGPRPKSGGLGLVAAASPEIGNFRFQLAQYSTGRARSIVVPPETEAVRQHGPGSSRWRTTSLDVRGGSPGPAPRGPRSGGSGPARSRAPRRRPSRAPAAPEGVSRHALDGGDRAARGSQKILLDRLGFGEVVERRRGAVRIDVGDVSHRSARHPRGLAPCRRPRRRRRGPGR